ncbi:hypothetical protein [Leptospira interrogans]|uniref:hypothetical protein n=1 Tax=Leptospira interrogans TaxID=173 RepID=UPI00077319F1|nr:hypothetical protein [Leptospira interrogans]
MVVLSEFLYGLLFQILFSDSFLREFVEDKSFTVKSKFVRVPTDFVALLIFKHSFFIIQFV